MRGNPLGEFWQFVKQASSLREYIAVGAVAGPLVDLLVGIGPPWPNRSFVAFVTVAAELVAYMFMYELWHGKGVSALRLRFRVASAVSAGLLLVYLGLFAYFVWPAPTHGKREVIGIQVLPAIQKGIEERRASTNPEFRGYDIVRAFHDNDNDPEKVWERSSVATMRLLVLVAWILLFLAVTFTFTTFLILQRKRSP